MSMPHKYEWKFQIASDDSLDNCMRLYAEISGRRVDADRKSKEATLGSIFRGDDNRLNIIIWGNGADDSQWIIDYDEFVEQLKKAASMI